MRAALGANFFDTVGQSLIGAVQNDATTWLVQQYAELRAMPQRLAALRQFANNVLAKLSSTSVSVADDQQAVLTAGTKLNQLTAQYPAMMAAVDAAYSAIQQITAGYDANIMAAVGTTAGAVVQAQAFMSEVNDVNDSLKTVVDHLLSSGAITPSEADALYASGQPSSAGWGRYVLYGAVILGLYWLAKKVL